MTESETVLCYTVETGSFEKVWDPLIADSNFDYHLVSDSDHRSSTWRAVVPNTPAVANARLRNRFLKMRYALDHERPQESLYVDANVRIINNPRALVDAFRSSGADIGLYKHYSHTSLTDEVSMCIRRGKVAHPQSALDELALYEREGMPGDVGVWEGSVILKNHSSKKLKEAMKEWWNLYSRFQTRDQFSLPFVIWKHGLEVFDLDEHSPGREHYFVRLQHSEAGLKNRMARYLQARAPENQAWGTLHRLLSRLNPR